MIRTDRKTVTRAVVGLSLALVALTGCSAPEPEPVQTYSQDPTTKPLEEVPTTGSGPGDAGIDAPVDESNAPVSEHGKPIAAEVKKATAALTAAAAFMEDTKTASGYEEWLYYGTNPGESVRMRLLRHASSPESFCLQATSQEDPTMSVLYDSEKKKVLPDGESCTEVVGIPWENEEGAENSRSEGPGEDAPRVDPSASPEAPAE